MGWWNRHKLSLLKSELKKARHSYFLEMTPWEYDRVKPMFEKLEVEINLAIAQDHERDIRKRVEKCKS